MIRLLLRNIQCSRTVLATSMHDVSVAEEAGKWNRNPSVQSYERYLFLALPEFGNNRPTLHILFRSASFRETHRLSAFSDENYPYLYRELLQRLSGCLVRRGLPPGNILPMIPAYPDGQPTARPACRFPSRKHSWRPLRGTRYFSNGAAGSPFLPGSVRHERNRQIFRLVAGRELPLLSVSGSGYRR